MFDALPPSSTVREEGETDMVKFGEEEELTVRLMVVL